MSDMREAGRQTGHILLDVISAWDSSQPDESTVNRDAANIALERLNEIGAVSGTQHDDGSVSLDVSDLVGGALVTMQWLVSCLDALTSLDRLEVVSRARRFLDTGE